ncbi:MAG: sugar phosphate nucleotidyltransferase [Planctomycetota bacterium]
MHVRKAVITAAAPDQTRIPTQQLVDQRGVEQSALQLILREVQSCGVEETCIVVRPGDELLFRQAAGELAGSLHFAEQAEPKGYADALLKAESFLEGDAFLHLVGDHVYLSETQQTCAKQLVDVASEFECSVSAVQSTRENKLPYFGIVSGTRIARYEGVFEVQRVIEKPTPTMAEQELVTPGLRSGHYLGFFGMHVLTAEVLDSLKTIVTENADARSTLSDALDSFRSRHKYLAFEVLGRRHNLGVQYGLLMAQMAIGLAGADRDRILTELVDLLALRSIGGEAV